MRVNIAGHGVVKFPDTMSDKEVREVLKQFEPKKDDTIAKLVTSIESMLSKQKPQIVKEVEIKTIEIPKIMEKTTVQTVPIERIIEVPRETPSWRFTVDKDDGTSYTVTAEPIDG